MPTWLAVIAKVSVRPTDCEEARSVTCTTQGPYHPNAKKPSVAATKNTSGNGASAGSTASNATPINEAAAAVPTAIMRRSCPSLSLQAASSAHDLATQVSVTTDAGLLESEARTATLDGFEARLEAALGSPRRPMTEDQLDGKMRALAGDALDGVLDDLDAQAKVLIAAAHLP
jgi:hypothetical protein